jgi:hypothetical protein
MLDVLLQLCLLFSRQRKVDILQKSEHQTLMEFASQERDAASHICCAELRGAC